MAPVEKFYGLEKVKKTTQVKMRKKQPSAKARAKAERMVNEASVLYAQGDCNGALDILKQATKLSPNDYRAYNLAALIQEELGNIDKSLNGYFVAAMLSNKTTNNKHMWDKVYELAVYCDDDTKMISAIDKLYKKNNELPLLEKKMDILGRQKESFYNIICCEIDMMLFKGVDLQVFEKLKDYHQKSQLKKISRYLNRLIRKSPDSHSEEFLVESLGVFYRAEMHEFYETIYAEYYEEVATRKNNILQVKYLIAQYHNYSDNIGRNNVVNSILAYDNWSSVEDSIILELLEMVQESKQYEVCIKIALKIRKQKSFFQMECKLGELYKLNGEYTNGCKIYTDLLQHNTLNIEVKAKLYELYELMGKTEYAKQFENSSKIVNETKLTKDDLRYNTKECEKNRRLYEQILNVNEPDQDAIDTLLEDFFTNKFVIAENKKFKSFYEKNRKNYEVNSSTVGLVIRDPESKNKRDLVQKYMEVTSLHGLEQFEWHNVIRIAVYSSLEIDIEKTKELILKTEKITYYTDEINEFDLLGLKIGLIHQDATFLADMYRILIYKTNYSFFNVIYFLNRFVPNAVDNEGIIKLYRNAQRFYFLRYEKRTNAINQSKEGTRARYLLEIKPISAELTKVEKEALYTKELFIKSFVPRLCYISTIDKIDQTAKRRNETVLFLRGLLKLNNCTSRVLKNKKQFASDGIDLIREAHENSDPDLLNYNLGRAYHTIGMHLQAEKHYFKCTESLNTPLRKMAIYNLSLLSGKNKSRSFLIKLFDSASDK
ncbi:TAU like transcription factor [Enterospora canceri]|uniref:TAU like transcription factor n=1 Tax=Enterospora canceri TaxID=1081671 RepID=A0A1Y1S9K0_9MICR|nr:TAU like transcription factor [Enterospora canceri]